MQSDTNLCNEQNKPELRQGDQNDWVKLAQQHGNLQRAEYSLGNGVRTNEAEQIKEDGIFGPETLGFIKSLQCRAHLDVDGVIGPDTWAFLCRGAAGLPILREGSQGTIVMNLQASLDLPITGIFDETTAQAVAVYQQRYRLTPDRVVGEQTWTQLLLDRGNRGFCDFFLTSR